MLGFGIQLMVVEPESGHALNTWEIAEVARAPEGKALLKRYLKEIVEGPAFKGSPRSAQFLEYILWQSADGKAEDLKERTIGVELFGRTPAYDTGEDAIVRVTASDVRKRLAQHYSGGGIASEIRISLPSGGYVPKLVRVSRIATDQLARQLPPEEDIVEIPAPWSSSLHAAEQRASFGWRYWSLPILGIVAMIVGIALSIVNRPERTVTPGDPVWDASSVPWASIFDGSHRVVIVPSDPDIEEIQRISHSSLPLSDYANQAYLPPNSSDLSPSEISSMNEILRGDTISAFDGSIIANLALVMAHGPGQLVVKAARKFRMKDLQTDDNFIFLGNPRSNPWASMFDPVLDFRFAFDNNTQREFIRNAHAGKGENTEYIPTAGAFGTGESFAIISVFHNPGYGGRVLIIAGSSGEGTEAAGELITDPARWAAALQPCHLVQGASRQSLQVLLHLEIMAGSPTTVKTVGCHALASGA